LNGGKFASFTGVNGGNITINLGGDEFDEEEAFRYKNTYTVDDVDYLSELLQGNNSFKSDLQTLDNITNIQKIKTIFNDIDGIILFSSLSNGTDSLMKSIILETPNLTGISGAVEVIYKPIEKTVSGTYYLVDEDYVTNAIAGVTVPDATPTVKGIAKLYTSLGSNTDGAVDQNTVNTEISKFTLPLISDTPATSITGVNVPTIMESYLIPAGTLVNYNKLIVQVQISKVGGLSTGTINFYINTTDSISGATEIARSSITSGFQFTPLERKFSLDGTLIEGFPFTSSASSDTANSSGARGSGTYNRANDIYFIIGVNPTNIGETHILESIEMNARRIKTTI